MAGAAIVVSGYALICIFVLLARIFVCLAVINDCKAHGNDKSAMWGVLVFFFTFVAGIVYLTIRKSSAKDKVCATCGKPHSSQVMICDNCGNSAFMPAQPTPEKEAAKKKSKGFLITFIIMYVLAIVSVFVVMIGAFSVADDVMDGDYESYVDDYSDYADLDEYSDYDDLDDYEI